MEMFWLHIWIMPLQMPTLQQQFREEESNNRFKKDLSNSL